MFWRLLVSLTHIIDYAMAQNTFTVDETTTLMPFLLKVLTDKSRTTIKSYLTNRQVFVNERPTTQFDTMLLMGDSVEIKMDRQQKEFRHPMLKIVFEDEHLIVIEKQSGLLSMGTDREREKTALYILSQYVKRMDRDNMIFIIHRLDRDTSGLMMFAKSEKVKALMQDNWEQAVIERRYVAVAEGRVEREQGTISTFLSENKGMKVFVSNKNEGQMAVTGFKRLNMNDNYTLLELELTTGRKNQIRAHLEYIGHSVTGDKKYGAKMNPLGRVALHAHLLSFIHPITGKRYDFTTPIPFKFRALF